MSSSGSSEILREYLISLGYQTDLTSLRHFEGNLTRVQGRLLKVGVGVTGIVAATAAATTAFAYNMRKMYYSSELANSSVKNLQKLEFGFQQIGGSEGVLENLIKNFAQIRRLQPGVTGLIESMGIGTINREDADIFMDVIDKLKSMPEYIGAQYAERMFGIDPESFHMLITNYDKIIGKGKEYADINKKMNVDLDAQKKAVEEYTETLGILGAYFEALGNKIMINFLNPVKSASKFLQDSAEGWGSILDGTLGDFWKDLKKNTGSAIEQDMKALQGMLPTSKSTSANSQSVMDFFIKKGYGAEHAAGIAANLHQESGFNKYARGDSGLAYGVAQWHPDRQSKFKQVFGKDIQSSSLDEQLEFVHWELQHGRGGKQLAGAKGAAGSAAAFAKYYEAPRSKDYSDRMNLANTYLGQHQRQNAVTINQKTSITVTSTDPKSAAREVISKQDRVNSDLARHTRSIAQ